MSQGATQMRNKPKPVSIAPYTAQNHGLPGGRKASSIVPGAWRAIRIMLTSAETVVGNTYPTIMIPANVMAIW